MMDFPALCLFLVYIFPTPPAAAVEPPAYYASEVILLNCGQSEDSNDTSYRRWEGDEGSRYVLSNSTRVSSAVSTDFSNQAPYQTARVIHLPLTYSFAVSKGQKFLRLYFLPVISGYDTSHSLFSLSANSFTLLGNFSAFLYSKNTSYGYSFMKEFVVNVGENQRLNLTISPNSKSFAFINGIEIVSIPDSLYIQGKAIKYADGGFEMRNDTTMENMYRLDVGGRRSVDIQDDSGRMMRAWSMVDDNYIVNKSYVYYNFPSNTLFNYTAETPPYTAPAEVYTSARMMPVEGETVVGLEWVFPVDSGFYYMLRLHFCEFTLDVRAVNQRVFTVNINYKTMEFKADVVAWAGGPDIPIYRDYVTWVPDDGRRGIRHLRLSLFPYLEGNPKYYSALLNGLEIFKLSDANRSLAAANYEVFTLRKNKSRQPSVVNAVTGILIGVCTIVAAVCFLILRWRKKVKASASTSVVKTSWSWSTTTAPCGSSVSLSSDLCKHFTIDEIKTATGNFSKSYIIGKGGFGNVYRGLINRGGSAAAVAIKRLHPSSDQGAREFLTEIEILSKLRHLHLVSLIGYCNYGGEMILVYDYLARGTLRDHLYNPKNPPLTWTQRLQICLGAAKGLHYLHNGAERVVIHRDIKSTNILLDKNWVAKISDFGISKMGQGNDSFTQISTNVKGTFGYLDPKYLSTHQLTRKSDVYAFGVVLCEVLSGRAAVDTRLDEEQHSLAGWARYCIRVGEVDRLIDQNLTGQISAACLRVFVGIAGRCIHLKPLERPTMADVVMGLELSLVLQHTTADSGQLVEDNPSSSTSTTTKFGYGDTYIGTFVM